MRNSERNWSPDHSTKWSQPMARLRPWFLGQGSKRSRLDEGPSSSNRTVNSRCSEIELEHHGTLAVISRGARNKEEGAHGTASCGTEEDSATAVFTRVVPDPDRARQVVHTRLVIHLVRHRGSRTGRRRLAPLRIGDRTRRGVGIFSAERNCERARTAGPAGRTGPMV